VTPAELARHILAARRAVALTGAGISTAAGVPDFRGPEGLYRSGRYDIEQTFTITGFAADPRHFFGFARDLLGLVESLQPTFTHRFLAELERRGKLAAVITQNIDHLHQAAGSREILAVHGSFATATCRACGRSVPLAEFLPLLRTEDVPHCSCTVRGVLKPDVVLFGEEVRDMARAGELVAGSDLLLVLGSSLTVYPAAGLPELCPGRVVAVNRGPVGLLPGPGRHVVDAELDPFFREVAGHCGLRISDCGI
jgi:NAD-dependent deacetylase